MPVPVAWTKTMPPEVDDAAVPTVTPLVVEGVLKLVVVVVVEPEAKTKELPVEVDFVATLAMVPVQLAPMGQQAT